MSARRKRQRVSTAWRLAALLAGAFVIKLVVVLQLQDHILLRPDTTIDSQTYVTLARRVIAGDWALGTDVYYVSPLYIYFLALIQGLDGAFTAVRVAQILLGTATIAMVFGTAREWFGERAAWIAAAATALTGLFTFYEVVVLQSAIDGVLTAAVLWTMTFALRRESMRWATATGIALALATLSRPNMIVVALAVTAVLVVQRRLRLALLLVVGLAAGLAPVVARNVVVAHQWTLMSSQGGLVFLTGNGEGATGLFRGIPGIRPTVEGQAEDTRRLAEAALGRQLSNSEISSYFQELAWHWIRQHPGQWVRLLLTKAYYLFNAQHIALPMSYPFFAYDAGSILGWLLIGPWLLIPLGLVGLVLGGFLLDRQEKRDFIVWLAFVPAYAASVALFIVSERYRLPLLVPLVIGTGAAVDLLVTAWSQAPRRMIVTGALVAGAIATASSWPLRMIDGDARGEERTHMAENLARFGQVAEAERFATLALERYPQPSLLHYRVGAQFTNSGNFGPAITHLTAALAIDPNAGPVELALAQTLGMAGRCGDAIPHYRRALQLGIGPAAKDAVTGLAACGERFESAVK